MFPAELAQGLAGASPKDLAEVKVTPSAPGFAGPASMPTSATEPLGRGIRIKEHDSGGDLTFKGTRVLVKDVLFYVAKGKDWDWIVSGYHGISREAIAEAISLATEALIAKVESRRRAA